MSRLVARALLVLLAVAAFLGSPSASGRAHAEVSGSRPSWTWPVGGADAVTRPFAPPPHRYGAGHRGVDLLAPPGAAVRAAGAGRVSYSGLLAGRGVVVVVHGALRTTYEPVTATVALGKTVAAGEVIGRLAAGHVGCPAAACLHWGLRRGEDYLDPTRLVERGPVRLLPVGPPRTGTADVAGSTPLGAAGVADVGESSGRGGLGAASTDRADPPPRAAAADGPGGQPRPGAGAAAVAVTLAAGAALTTAAALRLRHR